MELYLYNFPTSLPKFPPGTLFLPMEGGYRYSQTNDREEFRHCLAQTSQLQSFHLPSYLYASFHKTSGVLPPVLRWGVKVDRDKLYKYIESRWPHFAKRLPVYRSRTTGKRRDDDGEEKQEGKYEDMEDEEDEEEDEDEEEEMEELPESEWKDPDYSTTFYDGGTCLALRRKFGIPENRDDLFDIDLLYDDQGNHHFGIVFGTNYGGVVPESRQAQICKILDIQEEPRWYLDCQRWYWIRDPKRFIILKKAKTTRIEEWSRVRH